MSLSDLLSKDPNTPNGRKYKLAIISLLTLVGGFAAIVMNPTDLLVNLYSEFATGIFLINTAYYGGNVANKWVTKKPLTQVDSGNNLIGGEEHDGNVSS